MHAQSGLPLGGPGAAGGFHAAGGPGAADHAAAAGLVATAAALSLPPRPDDGPDGKEQEQANRQEKQPVDHVHEGTSLIPGLSGQTVVQTKLPGFSAQVPLCGTWRGARVAARQQL